MKSKIVFVSNFFNHHQKPFCDALYNTEGVDFKFVPMENMEEERKQMGYDTIAIPSYVVGGGKTATPFEVAEELIYNADIVICGFEARGLFKRRIKENKIIFYYTERPLKPSISMKQIPKVFISWKLRAPQKKKIYLLCASAYAPLDYKKLRVFNNKIFKWGYFPETKVISEPLAKKEKNSILWCGRLLELKHPIHVLEAVLTLKKKGYSFRLKFIGNGPEEDHLKRFVLENGLSENVEFCDFIPPSQVRIEMERYSIFLFTSDKKEGWGAVLNESMNSACAVITSHAVGASQYLVKDGENGLIYESGNVEMLTQKLKMLLDSPDMTKRLGKNAYKTIIETWNAENAASRFITLAREIMRGNKKLDIFKDGPCSIAEVISDDWIMQK